jgi:hypothetical protein
MGSTTELELELIQTHMAQKPLLWVEVGAHSVRNRSKCGGVGWAGERQLFSTASSKRPFRHFSSAAEQPLP